METNQTTDHSPDTHAKIIPISVKIRKSRKRSLKRWLLVVIIALAVVFSMVIIYQTHKSLPAGLSMEGAVHRVKDADIQFLYDLTYKSKEAGEQVQEHSILERVNKAIEEAEKFIVLDMFLFNGYYDEDQMYPPLSRTLTNKLIAQKSKYPDMPIVVITDEINTSYGSYPSQELELLKAHGIQTVLTDVDPLRDSTPLYSAAWRMLLQWFGQSGTGWIPNTMADTAPDLTLRSYLKLINVKANHRKVLVTDQTLIVPSANAHDASAYNSNSGFEVKGSIIRDALKSEQAAAQLSGSLELPTYTPTEQEEGDIEVRLLTEGKILQKALEAVNEAEAGDMIWIGMFYLADRSLIKELLQASARGVNIRLVLDPNQNAFGSDKIGIPNRPVAAELLEKSNNQIEIRWYNTGEEQYHTKLMLVDYQDRVTINNGSANFTKRNLDDLNLETNLEIKASSDREIAQQVRQYFERVWTNEGAEFTLDYPAYKDETVWLKRALYALQNWLGLTTF